MRTGTWGLLGLSGVIAIVAGVALNRPARTAPWLLLAVAQLSFVAGLKYQAFHDALTGLPNRLLFQERIWQQLTAARHGEIVHHAT